MKRSLVRSLFLVACSCVGVLLGRSWSNGHLQGGDDAAAGLPAPEADKDVEHETDEKKMAVSRALKALSEAVPSKSQGIALPDDLTPFDYLHGRDAERAWRLAVHAIVSRTKDAKGCKLEPRGDRTLSITFDGEISDNQVILDNPLVLVQNGLPAAPRDLACFGAKLGPPIKVVATDEQRFSLSYSGPMRFSMFVGARGK